MYNGLLYIVKLIIVSHEPPSLCYLENEIILSKLKGDLTVLIAALQRNNYGVRSSVLF